MDIVEQYLREALVLALFLSSLPLGVLLCVGLIAGMLQAMTQIQEQTLAYVPKLFALGAALLFGGSWIGAELVQFFREMLSHSVTF